MIRWSGIFHMMATPFTDQGALDVGGIPRLVEAVLGTGVSGLTLLGIAGEAPRLTDDERRRLVEAVVKEARGRVPIVAGASGPGTHVAAALVRMSHELGADAVMVAPPPGLKALEPLAEHYAAVAAAAPLPLVVQDEPVTTQVTMPAAFLAELCRAVPQVAAVKLEEAPTLPKVTALRAALERPVALFGGLGGVYFFEELARGTAGAMTGFPYPEALAAIQEHFAAGRREAARALFYRWLPLIRYESQPGAVPGTSLAIRKEIMRRRGWLASARVRPPARGLDGPALEELGEILAAVGA